MNLIVYIENFRFILKKKMNIRKITNETLLQIINNENIDFLKCLLTHEFYDNEFNQEIILNEFLLNHYKNKIPLSNKKINQYLLFNHSIININKKNEG